MKQQDREVLEKLGYNTERKCMRFFNDLILEVEECMDDYSKEKVVELINDKNSFIYVEMKIFYELGLNRMNDELKMIHTEMRDPRKIDIETYADVFNDNYNPTVEESIYNIAKYRKQMKNKNSLQEQKQNSYYIKAMVPSKTNVAM